VLDKLGTMVDEYMGNAEASFGSPDVQPNSCTELPKHSEGRDGFLVMAMCHQRT